MTREKQANVLHLRRQASLTFLFLARSRSVCLSLSPARALPPALSLSLSRGALLLSRSVCRPQILRPASKELPAFLEELPTTPRLPNLLITTLDASAIYPLLLLYLFQRFLLAPNFANMGKKFEAATHSMAFFPFFLIFNLKKNRQKSKGFGLCSPDLEGLKSLMCPSILCLHLSYYQVFFFKIIYFCFQFCDRYQFGEFFQKISKINRIYT